MNDRDGSRPGRGGRSANNCDLIRLTAAMLVIFSHCYRLAVPEMFALSLLATAPIAVLSRTFVESRALQLKNIDLPAACRAQKQETI